MVLRQKKQTQKRGNKQVNTKFGKNKRAYILLRP